MNNKIKKILSGIGAIVVFLIAGYFYLSAPEDKQEVTGGGADTSYETTKEDASQDTSENISEATSETTSEAISEAASETTSENISETTSQAVNQVTYEFRKQQYLDEHFEKHGSEFDYENADEYLAGANRVINDPDSLYKTEEEDGDHIYYLESTNEFVVVSTDGYIRTYFRPSAGIDYFNRQ